MIRKLLSALTVALLPSLALAAEVQVTDADIQAGQDVVWTAADTYILSGFVFVDDGATLTIEPGTVIKGKPGQGENASALIVARGGKIFARGTAQDPIIFTAEADNVEDRSDLPLDARGLWDGVIILGRASLNSAPGWSSSSTTSSAARWSPWSAGCAAPGPSWMAALADHYENTRQLYPEDRLLILFDIDSTILDMRCMMLAVLQDFDKTHNTYYFHRLEVSGIGVHENEVDILLEALKVPPSTWMWFNGNVERLQERDFRDLAPAHPRAIIQTSIDFLAPLICGVPQKAKEILDLFASWGINRFSIDWQTLNGRPVFDQIDQWGFEINLYNVPDLESFLQAVLLSPRSITSDFNFPKWHYYGRGAGEKATISFIRLRRDWEIHTL